jgi:hypothetical protein
LKEFATEEKFEIVLFASASGRGGRKGIWGNSARRANRAQNQFAFFQIHTADWERIEELEL